MRHALRPGSLHHSSIRPGSIRPAFLLLLGCALSLPVTAAQAAPQKESLAAHKTRVAAPALLPLPEEPARFVFLNAQSVAPNLLVPPAMVKTPAWRADMDKVVSMQKYAAAAEIELARAEQKVQPELVTLALGPDFGRARLPTTYKLLDQVVSDSRAATKQAKDYWHMPRPYVADKRVKLLINPLQPTNFAYPSGHTSTSLVLAKVLSDLQLGIKAVAWRQAARVAERRIIAGVHSPQDLTGGRQLAEAIYLQLKAQPAFLTAMQAARAELDAVHRPTHGCVPAQPEKKNWKRFKSRVTE